MSVSIHMKQLSVILVVLPLVESLPGLVVHDFVARLGHQNRHHADQTRRVDHHVTLAGHRTLLLAMSHVLRLDRSRRD